MLTTVEVHNRITSCMNNGWPLSLIRYGDGEAMILNALNDPVSTARVMRRQLGDIPTFEDVLKIRANLMQAYAEADIIGIPFNKKMNEPDSYWFRAQSILLEHCPVLGKPKCSIDIHSHFLDQDIYSQILAGQDIVNIITCRDLAEKMQQHFNICQVNQFTIAPEAAFTSYKGKKHYPDQFIRVEGWMDKQNVEGKICLVGAGVVGKIYCNWFRDRGGIAMDIGSIFDAWAGFTTRGPNRGRDKTEKENAL